MSNLGSLWLLPQAPLLAISFSRRFLSAVHLLALPNILHNGAGQVAKPLLDGFDI